MAEFAVTKEMTEVLKTLGEQIKKTEAYIAYKAALDSYTRSE